MLHVWPHDASICIHEQNAESSHPVGKMRTNLAIELSYTQVGLAYAGNVYTESKSKEIHREIEKSNITSQSTNKTNKETGQ